MIFGVFFKCRVQVWEDSYNRFISLSIFVSLSPCCSSSHPPPLPRLFQAKSCICHMCGAHLNRLHSCLYCVFFACFAKKHIHEHAKSKRHNLGMTHTNSRSYTKLLHCNKHGRYPHKCTPQHNAIRANYTASSKWRYRLVPLHCKHHAFVCLRLYL